MLFVSPFSLRPQSLTRSNRSDLRVRSETRWIVLFKSVALPAALQSEVSAAPLTGSVSAWVTERTIGTTGAAGPPSLRTGKIPFCRKIIPGDFELASAL